MVSINQITLNSGHQRDSLPSEVNRELYFALRKLQKEIFTDEGATVLDGCKARGVKVGETEFLVTLYAPDGLPVITCGFVKGNGTAIWKALHETANLPILTNVHNPPKAPYIADRLEVGIMLPQNIAISKWTADFSKCMAWVCLFPKEIFK